MADRTHQPSLPGADAEYIACLPQEQLRQFVDDFVSGRIFTSAHLRENDDIGMVFMPVVLGHSPSGPTPE